MKLICQKCGKEYDVRPYRQNISKYCSKSCSSKANYQENLGNIDKSYLINNQFRKGKKPTNAFKKGHTPWNKGLKGIHLNPTTEFKKGRNGQRYSIGTIKERIDKNGCKRNYIKVKEPNTWVIYYKYLWEKENGKTPKGYVIHHINKVPNDDRLDNLKLLTRAEHINIHRKD